MAKIKVKINNQCIGCGTCAALVDEVFEMTEDGYARVKEGFGEITDEELIKRVKEARDACPVQAIEIEEEE